MSDPLDLTLHTCPTGLLSQPDVYMFRHETQPKHNEER